jgi:hypothetical protein
MLLSAAGIAHAQIIAASGVGFYRNAFDDTFDSASVGPISAGASMFVAWNNAVGGSEIRDVAVFSLASLSPGAVITAAELRIGMSNFGYNSVNPSETVEWVQVTTPAATILSGAYSDAVWTDLGDGTAYGSRTVSAADNGTTLVTVLNSAALAALNGALGGTFALGGHLTTIDKTGPSQESIFFNGSGQPVTLALTLAIPEPETYALLLAGLGLLGFAARRRRPGIRAK